MRSLVKFDINKMVGDESTGEDEDEVVDFLCGYNWASVGVALDARSAFNHALQYLSECWDDCVTPADVEQIKGEFEKQEWAGWGLQQLLEDEPQATENLREEGRTPKFCVVIDVLLEEQA